MGFRKREQWWKILCKFRIQVTLYTKQKANHWLHLGGWNWVWMEIPILWDSKLLSSQWDWIWGLHIIRILLVYPCMESPIWFNHSFRQNKHYQLGQNLSFHQDKHCQLEQNPRFFFWKIYHNLTSPNQLFQEMKSI